MWKLSDSVVSYYLTSSIIQYIYSTNGLTEQHTRRQSSSSFCPRSFFSEVFVQVSFTLSLLFATDLGMCGLTEMTGLFLDLFDQR